MRCRPSRLESCLFALLLVAGSGAWAEQPAMEWGGARGDVLSARLRYGVRLRSGEQSDRGPGLSYSGGTPNDFALGASGFFLWDGALGLTLDAEREAFSLKGGAATVTGGALFRFHLLPSLRASFGPLEVQGMLGYGFAQLPDFGSSAAPALAPASRHSAVLGLRAAYLLPFERPTRVELEGFVPLVSGVHEATGASAHASGFSAAAHVLVQLAQRGPLAYSAVLTGQLTHDDLTAQLAPDGEKHSSQRLLQFGLGLEVAFLKAKPPPAPVFGGLALSVVDAETGAAVPEVSAVLVAEGAERPLSAVEGRFPVEGLTPGAVTLKASAPGYLDAETGATVVAGQSGEVRLALRPEPKFGTVELKLVDKLTEAPITTKVVLEVRGQRVPVSPEGTAQVANLPPGPVAINVTAPGYRKAQEVVAVVAGQTSAVSVGLLKVQGKLPAHVSGLVRSRRGGKPLAAKLEIATARIRTGTGANGAFRFDIPAGTYRVVISAPGHLSQAKRFTVKEGGEAIFNIDLYPARER